MEGAEQEVLSGMPHHQVETPLPIDLSPDAEPGPQVVAGHHMDYLLAVVVDVGHSETVDLPGVADLPSAPGVEGGAVQDDLVAVDGDHACLEDRHVPIVSENFVCHDI